MDIITLNVDSSQTTNPINFKYMQDSSGNHGFQQINNVIEIELKDIKFTNASGEFLTSVDYIFLNINDFKFIRNNSSSLGNYTTKLTFFSIDEFNGQIKASPSVLKFRQPISLKELKFIFIKKDGTIPASIVDLLTASSDTFSFTLNVKYLSNSVLKSYDEMFTFSEDVLQRMAYSKMIQHYDNLSMVNKDQPSITNSYQSNFIDLHNNNEFNPDGNRINYDYKK